MAERTDNALAVVTVLYARPVAARNTYHLAFFIAAALSATSACDGRRLATSALNRVRGDGYALDAISRKVSRGTRADCPENVATIEYRGELIRYASPVRIAREFAPKLRAFERAVVELAEEHYGRAPDRKRWRR